jgi:uncharacterized protein involved in type VI secretion and phage assembly
VRAVEPAAGPSTRWYGVYPALVDDVRDPNGQGRVAVRLPWAPDERSKETTVWARLATLLAGDDRGTWFVPEVDDEVLVAFEAGDPSRPYVVGSLWNGHDEPPASEPALRRIRTRSGHELTFDDTEGAGKIELRTGDGARIVLDGGGSTVTVEDASGNSVTLGPRGIRIDASSNVTVNASKLVVNAALSEFHGLVKADTVVANSMVSASYTPGAGNIW